MNFEIHWSCVIEHSCFVKWGTPVCLAMMVHIMCAYYWIPGCLYLPQFCLLIIDIYWWHFDSVVLIYKGTRLPEGKSWFYVFLCMKINYTSHLPNNRQDIVDALKPIYFYRKEWIKTKKWPQKSQNDLSHDMLKWPSIY